MSRIQFTSSTTYAAVAEPVAQDQDKGIESHNAIRAFFQNLVALLKICSPIFEYKINQDTTLYLNLVSFNNWLSRHNINKVMEMGKTDTEIAGLVKEALGIAETGENLPISPPRGGFVPPSDGSGGDPTNKTSKPDVF